MTDTLTPRLCGPYARAERVPLAPFQAWLEREITRLSGQFVRRQGAVQELARRMGVTERTIRRWRDGEADYRPDGRRATKRVSDWPRPPIEDALWRLGIVFTDLYPDHEAPDVPVEPDMWCPRCQQLVTPIYGVCPWCDTTCKDDGGRR